MKRLLPDHMGRIQKFRIQKRQEFRDVMKAIDTFRFGCAFTPAYDTGAITRLEAAMKEVKEQISPRQWKTGFKSRPSSRA
jgi:hypothetical protein